MRGYDKNASSDWDSDGGYEKNEWINQRSVELQESGYHPATAWLVAFREYKAMNEKSPA